MREVLSIIPGEAGRQMATTGFSLCRFSKDVQMDIQEKKDFFCSRSGCSDEFGRHVMEKSMKLQCGHSMCCECLLIVKSRPDSEQTCDACQDEYRRELLEPYGCFAKKSLDTFLGSHAAGMDETSSVRSSSSESSEAAGQGVQASGSSITSSSSDESTDRNLNAPIDLTKAVPDKLTDELIGKLLAGKHKPGKERSSEYWRKYIQEYIFQPNKRLGTFVGISLQNQRNTATQLVDAGFVATRATNRICLWCPDCRLYITQFPADSKVNPTAFHRWQSPRCPYFGSICGERINHATYEYHLQKVIEEDLMECFWDIRDGSSMYSEVNRLDTFPNQEDEIWKNLAEFGCHLVRESEQVKCAFCDFHTVSGVLGMTLDFREIIRDHMRLNICPFLKGINFNAPNIPDVSNWNGDKKPTIVYSGTKFPANLEAHASTHFFPNMFNTEERLNSFHPDSSDTAKIMAEAGYFYLSSLGKILCFSCKFCLTSTDETSAGIWKAHASSSPYCCYVRSQIKEEFITEAVVNRAAEETVVEAKVVDMRDFQKPVWSSAFPATQ